MRPDQRCVGAGWGRIASPQRSWGSHSLCPTRSLCMRGASTGILGPPFAPRAWVQTGGKGRTARQGHREGWSCQLPPSAGWRGFLGWFADFKSLSASATSLEGHWPTLYLQWGCV